MNATEQKTAAKKFAEYWKDRGSEKSETQSFWNQLLSEIFGIEKLIGYIEYEKPVIVDGNQKYIDAYICHDNIRIIIEQKSKGINLKEKAHQSGGIMLTPYEQAKRYDDNLNKHERADYIITCNFSEFIIYDMDNVSNPPTQILLENLFNEYQYMNFLVADKAERIKKEEQISTEAGKIVGKLYDMLLKQYGNTDDETLKNLNALCVWLVFCFYAEDAEIFNRNQFKDYMSDIPASRWHRELHYLFETLDKHPDKRDRFDDEKLNAFPYVNGELFSGECIIPTFTDEIKDMIINEACQFNWRDISPTIFGAVFESTLNPETRRSGGMHYTSIQNIHKVINPLFLDELRKEFETIKDGKQYFKKMEKLNAFQEKLASIKFLDPACGSGNFLTETYISLRRLENEVICERNQGQTMMEEFSPIQISIGQFYGIEINDFAVKVAKTALWIAESQMMKETSEILKKNLDFLPLKSYANIIEGNALRIDWESVVPKAELDYIMGNPPFVGYSHQNKEQKNDLLEVLKIDGKAIKNAGKLDYVVGWYYKAIKYIYGTNIECAFVSTNSIVQGEQPEAIWKPLLKKYTDKDYTITFSKNDNLNRTETIHINFAYQPFKWKSESIGQATVHCVIIGFSFFERKVKLLYNQNISKRVDNINHYLLPTEVIFIEKRSKPLYDVPEMMNGNRPTDDGALSLSKEECSEHYSILPRYIKKFVGSKEYLYSQERFCFWVAKQDLLEVKNDKFAMNRFTLCREFRLKSTKEGTRKCADTPYLFQEIRQPDKDFIVLPVTTSEQRKYIPIGYLNKDVICSNALMIIPNADIYHFGVLISNVHMNWMRAFTGRLEMRYQYSASIVYNNFPWCNPTDEQKKKIEETAQAILDARLLYPDCTLSDLYGNEMWLYPELLKAHQENDKAVLQAYGFDAKTMTESSCVEELVKMYLKKCEALWEETIKILK